MFTFTCSLEVAGVFGLQEAEDSLLRVFGEELRRNHPPFDQGRAQSHESWHLKVSLTIRANRDCFLHARDRKGLEDDGNCEQAVLLCLVLWPIRIFTMLVALPISTAEHFIDYVRIHIRIHIRLQQLFSSMYRISESKGNCTAPENF